MFYDYKGQNLAYVFFATSRIPTTLSGWMQFLFYRKSFDHSSTAIQSTATRKTNDEIYAELVAQKYGTRHHWISNKCNNTAKLTEEVTEAKCHPIFGDFDTSLYLMFKEIKEKGEVTMLLSGEGSDEVFGGYHHIHWDELVVPGGGLSAFYQNLLKEELKDQLNLVGAARKYYDRIVSHCPTAVGESDKDKEYRRRIYYHIKAFMPALLERKVLILIYKSAIKPEMLSILISGSFEHGLKLGSASSIYRPSFGSIYFRSTEIVQLS